MLPFWCTWQNEEENEIDDHLNCVVHNNSYSTLDNNNETYLVIGLLMCGYLFGLLADIIGGCDSLVPHFGGPAGKLCPLDGSISLSVDHLSHLVLRSGLWWMPLRSFEREKYPMDLSNPGSVQCCGKCGLGCAWNLCRWDGVLLLSSSGLYHLKMGNMGS